MPMIAARHLGKPWDLLPARIFALWRTAPTRPFVFCLALMVYLLLVFSRVAFCQSSPTASEPGSPKDSAILAQKRSDSIDRTRRAKKQAANKPSKQGRTQMV